MQAETIEIKSGRKVVKKIDLENSRKVVVTIPSYIDGERYYKNDVVITGYIGQLYGFHEGVVVITVYTNYGKLLTFFGVYGTRSLEWNYYRRIINDAKNRAESE